MGPALRVATVGRIKAASLPIAFRSRLDQGDRPRISFGTQVEHPVRIDEGSLSELTFFLPDRIAAGEILAGPSLAVGITVQVIADANRAAMVIDHCLVGVRLINGELPTGGRNFEEIASDPIPRADVDMVVVEDWRRNYRCLALARRAPEEASVGRVDPRNTRVGKLDVLADSADLGNDW